MQEQPVLIHLIASNKWRGVQRYAYDICEHYHTQGWKVLAVTRDAKVVDDHFRKAGISLAHAPLHGLFDPSSAFIFARLLRDTPLNQTYVHVHRYRDAFTVLLAKRLARRPDVRVISTRHTTRPGNDSWLFRRIYNKINAHIFVSRKAYARFRSTWRKKLPMREETVHVLHNSINRPLSSPNPEPDKGPVFAIYAGSVVKGKGLETIIDALTMLRDIKLRLRIAGKGDPDYLDHLRRRALNLNVMDMIDWKLNPESEAELISQSHFAVLPSTDSEAFGLPNIAVMAEGRPQICSDNGAQTEYLKDHETALFVPPGDAEALAKAMRILSEDMPLRINIGKNAFYSYSDSLSWQSFAPELTEIYQNC